jgi:HlyD family secretion protein
MRVLYEAGGTSRQELDQAELALSSARSSHDAARARTRAAAADVESIRALLSLGTDGGRTEALPIRAPVSGRILRVHERSQRTVPAGTPLVDIAQTSELEVVADVLSTDAVRVQPGQSMLIEDWGGADTLRATVRTVGPGAFTRISALGVEEQRVEVVGELRDPPPSLGDGYRVTARVVVWDRPTELRVPVAALFRRDQTWVVFRIEDDRARLRTLRIGERGAEWAQVLEGLEEGDRVVLYPSDQVVDDTPVSVR